MSDAGSGMEAALHEDGIGGAMQKASAIRKCRYCSSWSNSASPWPLAGTPLQKWHPDLPWSRGKQGSVIGSICKPCMIASWFVNLLFIFDFTI